MDAVVVGTATRLSIVGDCGDCVVVASVKGINAVECHVSDAGILFGNEVSVEDKGSEFVEGWDTAEVKVELEINEEADGTIRLECRGILVVHLEL